MTGVAGATARAAEAFERIRTGMETQRLEMDAWQATSLPDQT